MDLHVAGAPSPGRKAFGPGWWHTERSDRSTSPSPRDWSNNKFSYYLSDATGYIHIEYVRSLNYNPLAIEINFHMVFSGFIDDVVKKESRQFLLNCFYAIMW